MKRWSPFALLQTVGFSAIAWAAIATACLCFGTTSFGWPASEALHWRLDSVIVASIVGGALGACGVTYQAVLRNPLADPALLGVSSGAMLAVYLWTIASTGASVAMFLGQGVCAFAGAMIALLAVLLLSQRRGRLEPVTLVLVGVIVNALCGSIFLLMYQLNLRADRTSANGGPLRFLIGAIDTSLTRAQQYTGGAITLVAIAVLLSLAGSLNIASLSEGEAQALGLRVHRLRWVALFAASLAAATAVALSGPIGFVGLISPHLGRLIVGSDVRRLLVVGAALGAMLLCVADGISRQLASHTMGVLPVGVLTGLLGGPFFLYLLWRSRRTPISQA